MERKVNYQYIQSVCCYERVLQLIKSIKNLWVEANEIQFDQEYCITFGSDNGNVIYTYTTSKPYEINQILKEIENDTNN